VIAAAVLCVAACVAFGGVAPAAGRRLPPAVATRLLAVGCVLAAGCGGFVLGVAASLTVARIGGVARLGHWSPAGLRTATPFPALVGVAAGLLVGALALAGLVVAVRRGRAMIGVHLACQGLERRGRVAVLDSPLPDAFTTPGPAGRIVVTTGLLRALDAGQRRALIAHERSHLAHRHVWWRLAADLAAAANPLLRRTAAVVAQATERWADEDAAAAVGSRRLVATAIAAAALARRRHGAPDPGYLPAAAGGLVTSRVHALLAPPPARRPVLAGTLAVLLLCAVVSAGAVVDRGEDVFDRAALPAAPAPAPHR
jgi:hypothetical protein